MTTDQSTTPPPDAEPAWVDYMPPFGPDAAAFTRPPRRTPTTPGQVLSLVGCAISLMWLLLSIWYLVTDTTYTRQPTWWEWIALVAVNNVLTLPAVIALPFLWLSLRKRARQRAQAGRVQWLAALDTEVPLHVAAGQVHGEPGRGLSRARFGHAADAGRRGEQATVTALAPLLDRHPGARLVNGLHWPGTRDADIDHVLLIGEHLALIDSKHWAAGSYGWDGNTLYRDGEVRDPLKAGLALSALLTALSPGHLTAARAWVVVHSAGPLELENWHDPMVRMVTPAQLLAELAEYAKQAPCSRMVDRELLRDLRRLMLPA